MYDVEDGSVHACGLDGVEGVVGLRFHVGADAEGLQGAFEVSDLFHLRESMGVNRLD